MKRFSLRAIPVALGLLLLASCNGSSSGGSFIGNLPGPPVSPAFARMFDGQDFTALIYIINPPFGPPLTPAASFSHSSFVGGTLAFNPANGVLAASNALCTGAVTIYSPPYSSSTVPTATIGPGGPTTLTCPGGTAWDPSGNLWVADISGATPAVKEFTPPFSATEVPAATNTFFAHPRGLAINPAAGLMFISDTGTGTSCTGASCKVYVVPAPYTGVPTATLSVGISRPTSIAVDQLGRLFVGFDSGPFFGTVKVYLPPYATGNAPAYTLAGIGPQFADMAFDSAQNLYVQIVGGDVLVFNGPILGSMGAPSATLGCPSGACNAGAGIGFGP